MNLKCLLTKCQDWWHSSPTTPTYCTYYKTSRMLNHHTHPTYLIRDSEFSTGFTTCELYLVYWVGGWVNFKFAIACCEVKLQSKAKAVVLCGLSFLTRAVRVSDYHKRSTVTLHWQFIWPYEYGVANRRFLEFLDCKKSQQQVGCFEIKFSGKWQPQVFIFCNLSYDDCFDYFKQ